MLSFKLSLLIWIGILHPYGMSCGWGCWKKWRICLLIAICLMIFLGLRWSARNWIIRSDKDERKRRHTILEKESVSHPPGLPPPLRLPRQPRLEPLPDILDLHQWISARAREEFRQRKGQTGLQTWGACIVVVLTTGQQNVRQGRRLRCLRQPERRLRKLGPRNILRIPEMIRST